MAKQQYKSDYKPTGNLAVDMVGTCISHYRRQLRLPEIIRLSPRLWKQFATYVITTDPACYDKEGVNFDDVMIVKGSMFQKEPLECTFPKPKFTA